MVSSSECVSILNYYGSAGCDKSPTVQGNSKIPGNQGGFSGLGGRTCQQIILKLEF
jgi:hypothetical protein